MALMHVSDNFFQCVLAGSCKQRAPWAVSWGHQRTLQAAPLMKQEDRHDDERSQGSSTPLPLFSDCVHSSIFRLFLLSIILISPPPSIPRPPLCLSFAVTKIGFFFFFVGGEVPRPGFNQVEDPEKNPKKQGAQQPRADVKDFSLVL